MLAVLKHTIVISAPLLLAGCVSVPSAHLRGHYTWGHEVRSFTPCGSTKSFWVVGELGLLQQLRAASEHSGTKPYQPIYIEVSGSPEAKASDGFAADYDGVYRFTEVHVAKQSEPTDCGAHG